jgi:type 1 glutamine amidotransferase
MHMRSWLRWVAATAGLLIGLSACSQAREAPAVARTAAGSASGLGRVLVYSRTGGFRHPSIADGHAAFARLAKENGFVVDATEDPSAFTDEGLARYRVVVFLHTSGKVLDEAGKAALQRWLAKGNGWVGVHAAADGDKDWPWYTGLVGARFTHHSSIVPATIEIADRDHPATSPIPAAWKRTDEWYNFATNPRSSVHVLATVDERTYEGGTMGSDHPIAWCQSYGGGRSFYTALGHTPESWDEPLFLAHVLGGVRWAAGAGDDCRPG